MLTRLTTRVLGFPAIWIALLVTMLIAQETHRAHTVAQFHDASIQGQRLERALRDIEERHVRTIRRTRDALLESRPTSTLAMLQWTSQHYVSDLQHLVRQAQGTLARLPPPDSPDGARFSSDINRVRIQLERIAAQAQQTGPIFDVLLEAISANDQPAGRAAQLEMERCDRAMLAVLRITVEMAHNMAVAQAWQVANSGWYLSGWTLLLFAVGLPATLYLSARPLQRLRRLALLGSADAPNGRHSQPTFWAPPEEELALISRGQAFEQERRELAARLEERNRECERRQFLVRRSEQELALMKFYNENLVNSLRSAIVVTDAAGNITAINRVARALLILDEMSVGQAFNTTELYRAVEARCGHLKDELAGAMEKRQARRFLAVPYEGSSQPLLLDLTVAPYQDESGAARGLLFVADDVTDAVQTKHQLLLAERLAAIGRLSAQVAHEIRNPLSAIGLNAELLEEEFAAQLSAPRGAEARQMLHAIGCEIERLTEVTETYLQLARLPQPSVRPVDINQLINDLFVMLNEELKTHGITLALDLQTPPPNVALDPGQLRQALLNIVRNSREAMPQGGALQVQTRGSDFYCSISIGDTGEGISNEVLPRVFEPFYSTKPYGTGLGLSLTQQIVMEHGGTVRIHSNGGTGTCVTISLPQQATLQKLSGSA